MLLTLVLCAQTLPVAADGGPILTDPELWARLTEGHQIAVVRLLGPTEVQVDLFISMLDQSGVENEVVFFVPLGGDPSAFEVREETNLDFEGALTEPLDALLRQEARRVAYYPRNVRISLLLGTFLINGGWSWPFWLLFMLGGCAALNPPLPLDTFETESSRVAIYGVEAETDLQALIETTGLPPAVRETLERLRGQQVAIVTLKTQPRAGGAPGVAPDGGPAPQAGLHLHWVARLASGPDGPTYHYPLGTGSAWAQPIELTRLYVVAPPNLDFVTRYPALGVDRSGFGPQPLLGKSRPLITAMREPAYAVDEALTDEGRIWRVTYRYSNATEDVAITVLDGLAESTQRALRRDALQRVALILAWSLGALVALALWVLAWRTVMTRFLGLSYAWGELRLWREALSWALLYPLSNALAVALCAVLIAVTAGIGTILAIPILIVAALGGAGLFLFVRKQARAAGLPKRRAVAAYLLVVGAANLGYLLYAVIYAAAVGAL
jgi:hypothetical protein